MAISAGDLKKCLEKCAQHEDTHHEMEQGMADEHNAMQKAAGTADAHHGRMAALHQHKATTHEQYAADLREAAEKCKKAADDELGKNTGDVIRRLDALENAVVPTRISAVTPNAPGVTAVPRAGGRPMPTQEKPNVPIQFEKLVSIEE
jgi:hypothetical protein